MGKYFLGSVGTAEAFRIDGEGRKRFMFRSNTLTDQGINVTSTQDEIRAGTGAPIVFTFNHDTSVQLTLTDVLWRAEYIEAKLGGQFTANATDYQSETHTADASGEIELDKIPVSSTLPCAKDKAYIIFYAKKGTDDWKMYDDADFVAAEKTLEGLEANAEYCVRYLANDDQVRELWVTSDVLPSELFLIITTPLYAGDSCNASNGKPAGHITFEVPRFRLDPNLDLALAMSSNISISLNGSALAYASDCNINGSRLMRIVECITDRTWYDGLEDVYIDPAFTVAKVGDSVPVYGIYANGGVTLLNDEYKFYDKDTKQEKAAFTFAAEDGTITVTVDSKLPNASDANDSLTGTNVTGVDSKGKVTSIQA